VLLVWHPCAEYHLSPKTRTTLRIICRNCSGSKSTLLCQHNTKLHVGQITDSANLHLAGVSLSVVKHRTTCDLGVIHCLATLSSNLSPSDHWYCYQQGQQTWMLHTLTSRNIHLPNASILGLWSIYLAWSVNVIERLLKVP